MNLELTLQFALGLLLLGGICAAAGYLTMRAVEAIRIRQEIEANRAYWLWRDHAGRDGDK